MLEHLGKKGERKERRKNYVIYLKLCHEHLWPCRFLLSSGGGRCVSLGWGGGPLLLCCPTHPFLCRDTTLLDCTSWTAEAKRSCPNVEFTFRMTLTPAKFHGPGLCPAQLKKLPSFLQFLFWYRCNALPHKPLWDGDWIWTFPQTPEVGYLEKSA